MSFRETAKTNGSGTIQTISGNISIDQRLGTLTFYQNGVPRVRLSNDSVGFQLLNSNGNTVADIADDGFNFYSGGTLVSAVSEDGFKFYSNGSVVSEMGEDGFKFYSNGSVTTSVGADGFKFYDSSGNLITQVDLSGLIVALASGTRQVLAGTAPTDGHPIVAVSKSGTDVITALGGS